MQARLRMLGEVTKEYGEMLEAFDRLTEIAYVRIRSHFRHTLAQVGEDKQVDMHQEGTNVPYLAAINYLAERACYTAEAIATLLWFGYADTAYESWRTMFNLQLNISDIQNSEDPCGTAERYWSASFSELHFHEGKVSEAGLSNSVDPQDLEAGMQSLRREYPGIEGLEGWIEEPENRRMGNRVELAGLLPEYSWDYNLAGKSMHGAALSSLKRPSVYFPGHGALPPVEQSPRGIEVPTLLAARSLYVVVERFIQCTSQEPLPEDTLWAQDAEATLQRLADLFGERLERDTVEKARDKSPAERHGGQAAGDDVPYD